MIVSRAAELSRLDDLLAALAGGEGSALVVRGEAGIGKTTLLETLAVRSGDAVTVIRTCGAETEAELTFSALADLLDPVLGELTRHRAPDLAPPVAAAIAQAAAGNPLALVELTAALNTDQRTGAVPLDLPLAPGRRLQHAFSGRVGALAEPARRALLIAAAHA